MNDIKHDLAAVADASAPTPLTFEQVRGRARRIRRRRTATALVGSAAAVAFVAALGVAVRPSPAHDGRVPPIAKTPSAPPTRAGDPDAVGRTYAVSLDVPAEQTSGAEPRVPYWSDGQIIDTDGSATPFPGRPFSFAKDPSTGDWVVIRVGEAHAELVRVTEDGRRVGGVVPTFEHGLAVGADGRLAVVSDGPDGWQLDIDGARTLLGHAATDIAVDGFTQSGRVLLQIDGTLYTADTAGVLETVAPDTMGVAAPQQPLVATTTPEGRWVARSSHGVERWSLNWAGVSSFSPDGRYVALVGDPQHRIPGSADWDSDHATGTLWIRTAADLLPVAAFTAPEGGYFWGWTWDGDTLLATVFRKGEWTLVRLWEDGYTVARASTKPGRGEQPAYVFGAS